MNHRRSMGQTKGTGMRRAGVAAVALIVGALIAWWMVDQASAQPVGGDAGERPVLLLGNESLPPISFIENGKPTGIVIDLADAMANHMHRPVEIRLMNWAEAQQLVLEGRADALLQINPNPERLKIYDFSEPLLTSEFTIFTSAERLGITSMSDLRGLKVGVEEKGLPIFLLQKDPRIIVKIIPDFVQGFGMLATGALDAVVTDRWVGSYVLAENNIRGVRLIEGPIDRSDSAIAVKKGNENLLGEINAALADIRRDGTYDTIIKSWRSKEVVFKTREQLRQQAWLIAAMSVALIAALVGVAALVMEIRRRKRVEEELRESEAKYRTLFENMAEEVHFWQVVRDEAGRIKTWRLVDANPPTLDTWGRTSLNELKEKTTDEIFGPGATEHYMPVVQKIMTEGVPYSFEDYFPNLDKYFRFISVPLRDHFITTGADITSVKKAEQALRESEERLQALMKALPVGVSFSDDQTCQRITGNLAVLAQFEIGPQDNLSASAPDSNAPGRQVRFFKDGRETSGIELPLQRAVAENREIAPMELEVLLPSGRRWFSEASGAPIRNAEGKVIGGVAVTVDITERKRAEEALRESEARLNLALRSAGMGAWHWDITANRRHFSDQACHLLGIDPTVFTGVAEEFFEVVHPDDRETIRTALARTLEQDVPYETNYRVPWPDGDVHYITARGKLVRDDEGRPVRLNGIIWDVSEQKRAEETLRTTVQRFHEILSNIFSGILVVTEDDRIEFANQNLCDQFDIAEAPSDLIGLTAKEMLQKVLPAYAEPEGYSARIQQILSQGQRIEDEEVLMHDGQVLLRDYIPILVDGKPRGRMWQHRDITERKRAEEELRKAHDELELRVQERTAELVSANEDLRKQAALLDLSHDAIFVADSADVVSFWNKGAEDLYGFTREQAIGNTACEFLQTRFPESLERVVSQVIDMGQWAGELRQTTSRGKELVVESRWALQPGKDGEPAGFLEVNRDITSRKIVEERFRKADRAYRMLSECNQAVIRQAEESELLHHICRIVVEVGGYRMAWVGFAEHDEKKTVRPVAHAGYDDGYLYKAGITWADEEKGRGPTGTAIRTGETCISKNAFQNPLFEPWRMDAYQRGFASSIALPLAIEGKTAGALTIYAPEPDAFDEREVLFLKNLSENLAYGITSIRSTTERRRSEEALKVYTARLELVNVELQDFAFVAAHDLQEPLRKIQTFCDMTVKRCTPVLDSTSKDYLDRVIKSASRMRQLLSDLLQFSQVATKPAPLEKIDLVKIVRVAVDVFEETVKNTGALVDIENMPSIEADESQMLRLFQNLIGNALKFHSGETPHIKVYGKLDRKGICEIFVKDNGIGFDPKFGERIFKPFQRLHGRGEYDGTGMGLSICRKIVERHGGTIGAESEPGKGSTFIIRLPVKQGRWEGM